MNGDLFEVAARVAIYFVPFLFSLCVHEFAHGWVAYKLGDPTAKMMGRLTINPSAHADVMGTYILPLISVIFSLPVFFGWARPVPVNSRNLKNIRTDMFWIASAGPASNLILAFIGAFLFVKFSPMISAANGDPGKSIFIVFIMMNLSLAFFNLIPIHPLDGGKIFAIFFSDRINRKFEELQPVFNILLLALFLSGGLARVLFAPVMATAELMLVTSLRLFGVQ
jgi:Zn-dependent protease